MGVFVSETTRIRFFPVNNGDTTLLEAGGYVVLTDINHRAECTDEDGEAYDFAPDLRAACKRSNGRLVLDVFVLTHPDKDHLTGFGKLLHLGSPDNYNSNPKEGEPLIFVNELWVSPYALEPGYTTEDSEPVVKEIKRRRKLQGTADGNRDGNRLKVLSADGDETQGSIGEKISWRLLAPTDEEADIPPPDSDDDEAPKPSCNDSSLVIRWTLVEGDESADVLLGGDATVEVWDRIWHDYKDSPELLGWHVLLAPHHCSRGAVARKDEETDEYVYSDDALDALGQIEGDGFVVSSSKPIKRDDDNPPSWEAKQKYLEILRSENSTANPEARFLNPETHKDGKPAPVVFELTASGLRCKVPSKVSEKVTKVSVAASTPGRYGSK